MSRISRRDFARAVAAAAAGLSARPAGAAGNSFKGILCFFSKHLGENDWGRLAQNVKKLGFAGVDLTVRPGGHVLPERAAQDLPQAVATIRGAGLQVPMITTALLSTKDAAAEPILSTAGRLSIPYFKPGYYRYQFVDVRKELDEVRQDFTPLAERAKAHGLQTGYHNHADYVGAPVWDMARIIDAMDPKWVGYYFDPRHAVVEGGGAGWKIALNLVLPRLKMVAIKDFYWEKHPTKGWQEHNCPLGKGMVDWQYFFKVLYQTDFRGPLSLHLEYEIPGSTAAAREENTLLATQRDLDFLKKRIEEAYGPQPF